MINYIIQVIVFQLVFLMIYDVFLQKETFFSKNRVYLLGTMVASFLLPKIKIPMLQEQVSNYGVSLNEIVINPQQIIEKAQNYQQINYISIMFWAGVLLFSILFFVKIIKLVKILFQNDVLQKGTYKLVSLSGTSKAFSFFNYIFLGDEIPKNRKEKIIEHELVHCSENHTFDLLFFEILKIVMWFNPLVYLYQKRIVLVHEFMADEIVAKQEKNVYIKSLLSEIFDVENFSFVNQFYKESLIKKRIIMLTKKKSRAVKMSKYSLLIPVLAGMLIYTSCNKENKKTENNEKVTIATKSTYDTDNVPYAVVTKKPNFVDRDKYKSDDFNKNIAHFVAENFNIKMVEELDWSDYKKMNKEIKISEEEEKLLRAKFGKMSDKMIKDGAIKLTYDGSGKARIFVQFTINKNGYIENIKVRAPHPKLKKEVIDMMKSLPKCTPAEYNGKKVGTKYTLPITFKIE